MGSSRFGAVDADLSLDGLRNDVAYAIRSLVHAPAFTVAAVLALGLGTGATAAVFSMLEGVVLRPLPFANPERLVAIWETNKPKSLDREQLSPVNFVDYRALKEDFDDIAGWWRPQLNLTDAGGGEPVRVAAIETSRNLFRVLGVKPLLGPGFIGDSAFNSTVFEAVISHRLWRSRYGGDPSMVGRTITLDGALYTVVGVMPAGFGFPGATDVWQSLRWPFAQHSRGAHFVEAVGRLKPGIAPALVNAHLATLGARLGREFKDTNDGWSARAVPLDHEMTGLFRPALYSLFGAAGLLLLIACINVANLLLARGTSRRREVAVRSAIGASRSRLIRLFLTESFVLASLGSAVGLAFAAIAVRGLIAWSPIQIPRADEVGVNLSVLAFVTLIVVGTTVAFGLVPALLASRADLQDALKDGAKGASGSGGRLRSGLVVAEVALAVMLLSGAGLLIRSVANLLHERTGVDPTAIVTVDVQLAGAGYKDYARVDAFYNAAVASLARQPEVAAVGAANFLPLETGWRVPYGLVGAARLTSGDEPIAQYHSVDQGYFSTMRVPLLRGRGFTAQDDTNGVPVVIVNETFARQAWPGENPVGKRIVTRATGIGPLGRRIVNGDEHQVIGVVRDIKNTSLKTDAEPALFFSSHQFPFRSMHLVVRTRASSAHMLAVIRDALRRIDPGIPLGNIKTMDRVLAQSVDPPRFVMLLLTVFALLALSLAAVGVYGIFTYVVSHRRKEIGIRIALGAQPEAMLRMIVREGATLALLGCALGVAGALLGGRSLAGFLYGVSASDPVTLTGVPLVVIAVAVVACLLPGRRAAGEDPALALRID